MSDNRQAVKLGMLRASPPAYNLSSLTGFFESQKLKTSETPEILPPRKHTKMFFPLKKTLFQNLKDATGVTSLHALLSHLIPLIPLNPNLKDATGVTSLHALLSPRDPPLNPLSL